MAKMYCVVFRTGGTENFRWQRTLALHLRETAEQTAEACRRAGHPAYVEDWHLSLSIGLPDTFEAPSRA